MTAGHESITPPVSPSTGENQKKRSAEDSLGNHKRRKQQRISFLQVKSCIEYRKPISFNQDVQRYQGKGFILNVPLCMDCFKLYRQYADSYKSDPTCRFRQTGMRRLQPHEAEDDDGTILHSLKVAEPVTEVSSPFPRDSLYHIEPSHSKNVVSKSVAEYILRHAARPLLEVLKEDKAYFNAYEREASGAVVKRLPAGYREWCDVCQTSIFDLHYTCLDCGFAVCGPCKKKRSQAGAVRVSKEPVYAVDDILLLTAIPCQRDGWPACCASPRHPLPRALPSSRAQAEELARTEYPHDLRATRMIPTQAVKEMEEFCQNVVTPLLSVQGTVLSGSTLHPLSRHIVRIPAGTEESAAMERFRAEWAKGDPVLVEGAQQRLAQPDIWRPEWFAGRFTGQSVTLVDCLKRPQEELPNTTHDDFWKGFTNYSERLKNKAGQARLLKIKDWPTHSTFKEQLPDHHADLMRALPVNDYAHVAGPMNLVTYLPDHFNPPDLGPKMYIAYGAAGQPKFATTNLHVDISDAVNVIVHVAKPVGEGADQSLINTKDELLKLNIDDATRQRIEDPQQGPGAVWQIFRAADAPRIADWLRKEQRRGRSLPAGGDAPDPIHTQEAFLDGQKRRRLLKETGVVGFDIVQFEGDAIFIPAGAPHQVWNVHSCIKVAEDFVSPEHLAHCIQLTKQFSQLPADYHNKHDKLQIKNILFQAVKTLAGAE